ncbi:MAG: hypothetical protein FD180_526 [Planctomycetota bacterium]|nr:MAG: hypothetical protein FD180_526 [Planctomycetota bacterium]
MAGSESGPGMALHIFHGLVGISVMVVGFFKSPLLTSWDWTVFAAVGGFTAFFYWKVVLPRLMRRD